MIATQMSVFSTACSSGVPVRTPRVTRPARLVRATARAGPTRLNSRGIPASAKGLGSLGLGSQKTNLLQRRTSQALSTVSRRSDLRVRAMADSKEGNPLLVGVFSNIFGAVRAVAAVFLYLTTTIIAVPFMCFLAIWAPIGLLLDKFKSTAMFSVGNVWKGLANLFWYPIAAPGQAAVEDVTEDDVLACQAAWAGAIKNISKTYLEKGDYIGAAGEAAGELYGYGHTNVLFKPTKAAEYPFRPTGEEAMSYFVGGSAVDGGYKEDGGFAINGGKGWSDVVFTNHQIECNGDTAIAMGSYVFTCATTGSMSKVEYTFGYKRNEDGKPRIFLHHSSVPYSEAPAALTEAEVIACQDAWAGAIKTISKTHLEKGDYIGAAAEAAGELYGYGHTNVLFKPTKAAEYPFRPTGEEAMSYFVGGSVVDGGYKEDAGFAINGGKGWSDVVFTNHQIDIIGDAAIAMGSYVFTCATTGAESKVEYTFGYKRNEDGKNRIFLHHSSVPYSA